MRIVCSIFAALLCAFFSPLLMKHGCALHSSILAVPITLVSICFLPLLVLRQKTPGKAWLWVFLTATLSLAMNLIYGAVLHSPSFPESLLDKNAIRLRNLDFNTIDRERMNKQK
jgi:hypothetical protein